MNSYEVRQIFRQIATNWGGMLKLDSSINNFNFLIMNYKNEILAKHKVGDNINAYMSVKTIGRKYVTCLSRMGTVHFVKYTLKEFYYAFC